MKKHQHITHIFKIFNSFNSFTCVFFLFYIIDMTNKKKTQNNGILKQKSYVIQIRTTKATKFKETW